MKVIVQQTSIVVIFQFVVCRQK